MLLELCGQSGRIEPYCNLNTMQVNGHKLLIFADYSMEVTWRSKTFLPICSEGREIYPRVPSFSCPHRGLINVQNPRGGGGIHPFTIRIATGYRLGSQCMPPSPQEQCSPRKDPPKLPQYSESSVWARILLTSVVS